jgi:hypothetical protein
MLLPAPEYTLHTGHPEYLRNGETGIAIALQMSGDCYREILAIKPVQMIDNLMLISPGVALESTPVR